MCWSWLRRKTVSYGLDNLWRIHILVVLLTCYNSLSSEWGVTKFTQGLQSWLHFWLGSLSRKLLGSSPNVVGSDGRLYYTALRRSDQRSFGSLDRSSRVLVVQSLAAVILIVLEIVFDCHLVVIVLTVVQQTAVLVQLCSPCTATSPCDSSVTRAEQSLREVHSTPILDGLNFHRYLHPYCAPQPSTAYFESSIPLEQVSILSD